MKRTSTALFALAFATSLFGADVTEDIRVNRIAKKPSVRSASATERPSAVELRSRILSVVPPRPSEVRDRATSMIESRPTAYAVSWRGNGTPRQLRPHDAQSGRGVTSNAISTNTLDTARTFLRTNRALLRLNDPDRELAVSSQRADDLGGTDIRFTQQWEGIPVWPAEMIVHLDRHGSVELVEGAWIPSPRRLHSRPIVDSARALARVQAPDTTAGVPVLIVHSREGRRPRLAWKTTLTRSMAEHWTIVVDAMTGQVLQRFSNVQTAAATGSGVDLSGTTRQLKLWRDGANYYLADTTKQMFDSSSTPPSPNLTRGGIFVSDFGNGEETFSLVGSTNPNSWPVRDSVSAAFWLSQTYDYFLEHHGRDSIDGNKGSLTAAVRFKSNYPNAFWYDEQQLMVFGDAETYAASLDVIAHEMAHGVTSHSANLVYEGQSGALNEAMSDIFGEMAEADFYGDNDWLMGTHIGSPIRSMSSPGAFGHPGKMSQFLKTTEDNGGVHSNSGIINRAFYLLAEGMPGAIGRRDAERIFYRALTQHLTKDSQFIDARIAAILSAGELFGGSSNQAQKTAGAFDMVEIFAQAQTPDDPGIPVVTGPDSLLFLYYDGVDWLLGRREGSDPAQGVRLLDMPVAATRASVSGDGALAVFVSDDQDACLTLTSGAEPAVCLDLPSDGIFVSSVGMSPDGSQFGFVLLGEDDFPENRIIVVTAGQATAYDLSAPVFDGESLSSIEYADVMTFSADGRFLVYDALNVVSTSHGDYSAWSIYALDLETTDVFSIVPVIEGLDIGFPSLGHTSDDLLTFEAYDPETDEVTVVAADLAAGEFVVVAVDESVTTSPSYSGDDRAIVFAVSSDGDSTGSDLARQALTSDHITPSGSPTLLLAGAAYPSVYRRGVYSGPTTDPGNMIFASPSFNVNEGSTVTVTVLRSGGNKGAVSVSWTTSNGTATAGADYVAASGTLTWADGEDGPKMFPVRANSDSSNESSETVRLTLSGANLGSQSTATLTIANQAPGAGKRRSARH